MMEENHSSTYGDEVLLLTCSAYDKEKKYCMHLKMKFYEGMERPCENVPAPDKCPIVLMRE